MRGTLLMHCRDVADAGCRKNIERIHQRRTDDAEHVGHVVGDQGLNKRFARCHSGFAGYRGPIGV